MSSLRSIDETIKNGYYMLLLFICSIILKFEGCLKNSQMESCLHYKSMQKLISALSGDHATFKIF